MINLWQNFLTKFKHEIKVDKEKGFIYIQSFLWYTDAKLEEDKQPELEQLLSKYLSEEEQEDIMRTIAQKYIEEGEARGEKNKAMLIAKNLKKAKVSIKTISRSTGLTEEEINKLKD